MMRSMFHCLRRYASINCSQVLQHSPSTPAPKQLPHSPKTSSIQIIQTSRIIFNYIFT